MVRHWSCLVTGKGDFVLDCKTYKLFWPDLKLKYTSIKSGLSRIELIHYQKTGKGLIIL